jgi:hypothetical protein
MGRIERKRLIPFLAAAFFLIPGGAFAQQTLGNVLTNTVKSTSSLSTLESMLAYFAGMLLMVVSIFKFKDHVDNPQQTPISAGFKRFFAAGMFLSLPFMTSVVQGSIDKQKNSMAHGSGVLAIDPTSNAKSLDTLVVKIMKDAGVPMEILLSLFSYLMAIALLLVGINRMTKRMDEGPRGPAGMGTIMTFITSGVLFAWGDVVGAFTNTMFTPTGSSGLSHTIANVDPNGSLKLGTGVGSYGNKINMVVQGVMMFVVIIGLIAFIRGWLVLRAFADGQQGATLAQGLTFLFGGALAINLGDLVNAFQASLGISGITFS